MWGRCGRRWLRRFGGSCFRGRGFLRGSGAGLELRRRCWNAGSDGDRTDGRTAAGCEMVDAESEDEQEMGEADGDADLPGAGQ